VALLGIERIDHERKACPNPKQWGREGTLNWHFVLWPEGDGQIQAFMQQTTNMHVKRWKEHRHETGYGHLYQGRYRCFPVETDEYFYWVVRYVERNALRANLVARAECWAWSSLRRGEREDPTFPILSPWPLPRPTDWLEIVNQPQTEAELEALRRCVTRGCPLGGPDWVARTAKQLALESTLRPRGRPRDSW
jgi:putative transposase